MNDAFWMGILQTLLSAGLVLGAVYMLLKKFFDNEERRRYYEIRANNQKISLPIRLQAYERLALLLERLSINNLIVRVKKPGMSAADLQAALVNEIRAEYDHNVSQQIYVSNDAWQMVTNAKEAVTRQIHVCYSILPGGATSMELSKAIFDQMMKDDMPSTYNALVFLKEEAQQIFV
jgi:hypothetical protein